MQAVTDSIIERHSAEDIAVLTHWAIDETQASTELFKTVYGIPEEGDESYGSFPR